MHRSPSKLKIRLETTTQPLETFYGVKKNKRKIKNHPRKKEYPEQEKDIKNDIKNNPVIWNTSHHSTATTGAHYPERKMKGSIHGLGFSSAGI